MGYQLTERALPTRTATHTFVLPSPGPREGPEAKELRALIEEQQKELEGVDRLVSEVAEFKAARARIEADLAAIEKNLDPRGMRSVELVAESACRKDFALVAGDGHLSLSLACTAGEAKTLIAKLGELGAASVAKQGKRLEMTVTLR